MLILTAMFLSFKVGTLKVREPYREKEQKRLIFQPFLFMKGK